MSLARPTSTVERGSGVAPDSGPTAGWKELGVSDVATSSGNYALTHGAGSGGFTHQIVIDDAANSYYLDRAQCASVYFDTGLSMSDLRGSGINIKTVSVALEFNIAPGDALITDAGGFFNFGLFMTNSTTLSSGAMGGFGGAFCTNAANNTAVRPVAAMLKYSGDTKYTGIDTFGTYDYANGDTFNSIQISGSGFTGPSSGQFGFTGLDLLFGFKSAGSTYYNSETEYHRLSNATGGAGNLVIGAMFGQRVVGASALDKTFNFNLKYLIETA